MAVRKSGSMMLKDLSSSCERGAIVLRDLSDGGIAVGFDLEQEYAAAIVVRVKLSPRFLSGLGLLYNLTLALMQRQLGFLVHCEIGSV